MKVIYYQSKNTGFLFVVTLKMEEEENKQDYYTKIDGPIWTSYKVVYSLSNSSVLRFLES